VKWLTFYGFIINIDNVLYIQLEHNEIEMYGTNGFGKAAIFDNEENAKIAYEKLQKQLMEQ
jgi:hypothetical protein